MTGLLIAAEGLRALTYVVKLPVERLPDGYNLSIIQTAHTFLMQEHEIELLSSVARSDIFAVETRLTFMEDPRFQEGDHDEICVYVRNEETQH